MNNLINVKNENGQLVVSSRQMAEDFGKEHKNVLQSILKLAAENSTAKKMFIESSFVNRGKFYPEYLLTRDGFALLAMGFTGQKALEFKLKYIEAFNKMEEQLNNSLQNYLNMAEEDRAILYFTELKEKKKLELDNKEKDELLLIAEEKNTIADKFLSEDSLYSIDSVSKVLGIKELGRNNFYKYLREEKILMSDTYMDYKGNTKGGIQHFTAYAQYTNTQCYFKHRTRNFRMGKTVVKQNVAMFTPKGIEWIIKKLQKSGYIKIKTLEEIVAELRDVKEVA